MAKAKQRLTKRQALDLLSVEIDKRFDTRIEAALYFNKSQSYLSRVLAGRYKEIPENMLDLIGKKVVIEYE